MMRPHAHPERTRRSAAPPLQHEGDDCIIANVAAIGRAMGAKYVYLALRNAVSLRGRSSGTATKYWGWSEARGVLNDIDPEAVEGLRCAAVNRTPSAGGGGCVFVRHIPSGPGRGAAFVVISWDDAASGDEDALTFIELLTRMVLDDVPPQTNEVSAPDTVSSLIEECRLPVLCVARDILAHVNSPAIDFFGGRDAAELMNGSIGHVTRPGHRETEPRHRSGSNEPEGHRTLRSDPRHARIYSVPLLLDGVPYAISAVTSQGKAEKRRMIDALEHQRQRIGLELHDGLGQLLTAARIASSGIAEAAAECEAPYRDQCEWLTSVVDEALALMRGITDELSPAQLLRGDDLAKALEGLAEVTRRISGVECTLACSGEIEIDDPDRRVHVYRIVQEAVNNSVKHARANNIAISVEQSDMDEILITVMDDGVGVPTDTDRGSVGIESMRYRAGLISGDLSIESLSSRHTTVTLKLRPAP